jgi:predicted phage-related endonuclease
MTIQTFSTTNRPEWLSLRHRDVTGSEVGALFNLHRYLTPAQLYAKKVSSTAAFDAVGSAVTRGQRLEKFVADQLHEEYGFAHIRKADMYYRDTECRLGGTPDYFIPSDPNAEFEILEIKTIAARDFVEKWRGGDPEGEIIPESWQLLQAQTYMYLTGAPSAKFAVLPVSDWAPMDIHIVNVVRRQGIIDKIRERAAAFWEAVDHGVVPPFDYEKDTAAIKAIYAGVTEGKEIDLRNDIEIIKDLDVLEHQKAIKKEAESTITSIENRIRAKMRDAEFAAIPNGQMTLKTVNRKECTVAATSYRQLRYKRF